MPRQNFSEESYQSFSDRLFDHTIGPLRAQFELTYRCNIHCVHCYTDPFNTPEHLRQELPLETIISIFDQMAAAGVLWLTLTGGEAFLHPHFRDIYRAAKARGFLITLFSNGTVITDSLADFLAEDPPFKLEVSLHAATQETFERITQVPGTYARFNSGVQKLVDRGLPIVFKSKAMTLNREELPALKAAVEGWGESFNLYTSIYPRLDGDLSSTQYRLNAKDIVDLEFRDTLADDDRCPTENAEPSERPSDDRLFRCGCGTNSVTINPYGIMRACTFTTWPAFDLKTMPLPEAFEKLVSAIQEARYQGESPCRSCPAYQQCDKNPVMALVEAGSMEAPVPHFCDTAFERKARLESLKMNV
jgi:radical SAM protein with 4Fe4S-binding SPASM domain